MTVPVPAPSRGGPHQVTVSGDLNQGLCGGFRALALSVVHTQQHPGHCHPASGQRFWRGPGWFLLSSHGREVEGREEEQGQESSLHVPRQSAYMLFCTSCLIYMVCEMYLDGNFHDLSWISVNICSEGCLLVLF